MTLDQFNSIFPFIASFAIIMNIYKLSKDKKVLGIHWASPLIAYTGQLSGIYFMYTLEQFWTMSGGIVFLVLCLVWYSMMIYYNYVKVNYEEPRS
jgi:hypothetical protein